MKQARSSTRLAGVLTVAMAALLSGCHASLLEPAGKIAADEKSLIITSTLLMLIVVIPVIVLTLYFAWKYRESNTEATYTPNWSHSHRIEVVVWGIPIVIIVVLGVLTWKTTHALDPYKPLESERQADHASKSWRWTGSGCSSTPTSGIATVNEIQFPAGTPVNFKITSDTVMNSFFIPQLGSQIYAMAGMQTQVHLIADAPGVVSTACRPTSAARAFPT